MSPKANSQTAADAASAGTPLEAPAPPAPSPAPQRRRGAALEEALLDAAWDELVEKGYDAFTIDSVASRAGTSRTVLYRRWPAKPELVRAAVVRNVQRNRIPIPDTGSLRGDVIGLFRAANRTRAEFGVIAAVQLGAYFAETGESIADLRAGFVDGRTHSLDIVIDRAVERGEIDAAKLTPRVRGVAFDLYRHELLMTLKPVPDAVIAEIVDEIFLPLVRR
jgi:AcrR family transcriptional regulator